MTPPAGEIAHVDAEASTILVRFPAGGPGEDAVAAAALGLTSEAWVLLARGEEGAVHAQLTLREPDGLSEDERRERLEALASALVSAATWQGWAGALRRHHKDRIAEIYRRALGGVRP